MIPHVPEPVTGDIVQLILDDHRLFEALLRELRLDVANREVLRACFADVVLAHGEAEEQHVYTSLQRRRTITAHEAEHGEEEHAELNAAMGRPAGTDTPALPRLPGRIADADADTEIARASLRGRYGLVLTCLDLDEIDPWS